MPAGSFFSLTNLGADGNNHDARPWSPQTALHSRPLVTKEFYLESGFEPVIELCHGQDQGAKMRKQLLVIVVNPTTHLSFGLALCIWFCYKIKFDQWFTDHQQWYPLVLTSFCFARFASFDFWGRNGTSPQWLCDKVVRVNYTQPPSRRRPTVGRSANCRDPLGNLVEHWLAIYGSYLFKENQISLVRLALNLCWKLGVQKPSLRENRSWKKKQGERC